MSVRRAAKQIRRGARPQAPPASNIAKPRTKPSEVRRQELMDAAQRLFLEQGIAATSIDEIVAAAEVAKGTFYLHFESKERLLFALQERWIARICRSLEDALAKRQPEDWEGRLRAWIAAGVHGYLDEVEVHDLVFHDFRPDDRCAISTNPALGPLTDLLAQGARAGAWSVDDPRLTAVMLFNAMHGAADEVLASGSKIDRKALIRALETFFLRAVQVR
jgi:AcrR family transcriptional regulator